MRDWSRRVWATVVIIACAHALQFVALPWLDPGEWDFEGKGGGGWLIAARETSMLSVASLGISPLVAGLGLTTIVFAIVPKLRRSLDEPAGETRLLRAGFVISVLFALLQSNAIALFFKNMSAEVPSLTLLEAPQLWLIGGTLALFAMLYAALPFALERWGLGRGLSAAVLLYCLLELAKAFHAIGFDLISVGARTIGGGDLVLFVILIAGTVAATRRWVGDAAVLPSDPRLDRVGRSLSIALIVFAGVNLLLGQLLVAWAAFGEFGTSLFELCTAVGGGLLLAGRGSARNVQPIAGNQLLALGSFVLFIALATMLLTDGRLPMPWAETVIATILIYMSWRESAAVPAVESAPA